MTDDPIATLLDWPHTSDDQVLLNSALCEITVGDLRRLRAERDLLERALEYYAGGDRTSHGDQVVDSKGAYLCMFDGFLQRARDAFEELAALRSATDQSSEDGIR